MSITPWPQGTRDVMYITISPLPQSFAFINPSMVIRDRTGYAADQTGTGTFAIQDLSAGSVTYTPSIADVSTAGDFELFLKFYDATGTVEYIRQMGEWLVTPV
jgi:hypothetical protein